MAPCGACVHETWVPLLLRQSILAASSMRLHYILTFLNEPPFGTVSVFSHSVCLIWLLSHRTACAEPADGSCRGGSSASLVWLGSHRTFAGVRVDWRQTIHPGAKKRMMIDIGRLQGIAAQ